MKNKRRLTAMLLAGCLTVSSVPVAFAEDAPVQQQEQTTLTPEQQQEQVFALADQAREDSKAAAPTEGTCGENASWKLEGGTLTISGTGEMTDYDRDNRIVPWYNIRSAITRVVVEKGITSIGDCAFDGCVDLTNVTISDSVAGIGYYAFNSCKGLTNVTIPDSVISIGYGAFYQSGLTRITLPRSITSIEENTFTGCSSLASVEIPNSVTSIGDSAFGVCSSLANMILPDSVTSIGDYAFERCGSLTSVTIPDSVTNIGHDAFYQSGLTSIVLPRSITSIEEGTFDRCSSLINVTIPNSVTDIGNGAFNNCSSLTSVIIPDSVTSIGRYAFGRCASLANISLSNSMINIGVSAFDSCSSLSSVTIPDGVTRIGEGTFSGCSTLNSVTIPDSVTSIGQNAFEDCSSLSSVTIGSSVTSIGSYAFEGCSGLNSVTIPDSVTSIGSYAFSGCSSLSSVYYTGTEEQWKKISIDKGNTELPKAKIYYNCSTDGDGTGVSSDGFYFKDAKNSVCCIGEEYSLTGRYTGNEDSLKEDVNGIVWKISNENIARIKNVAYQPALTNDDMDFELSLEGIKPGITEITGTATDGRIVQRTIVVEPRMIAETAKISDTSVQKIKCFTIRLNEPDKAYLEQFMKTVRYSFEDEDRWTHGRFDIKKTEYVIDDSEKEATFYVNVGDFHTGESNFICRSNYGQEIKIPVSIGYIQPMTSLFFPDGFYSETKGPSTSTRITWEYGSYSQNKIKVRIAVKNTNREGTISIDQIDLSLDNLDMFKIKEGTTISVNKTLEPNEEYSKDVTLVKRGIFWKKPDSTTEQEGTITAVFNGKFANGESTRKNTASISYCKENKENEDSDTSLNKEIEKAQKQARKNAQEDIESALDAWGTIEKSDSIALNPEIGQAEWLGKNGEDTLELAIIAQISLAAQTKSNWVRENTISDEVAEKIMEKYLRFDGTANGTAIQSLPMTFAITNDKGQSITCTVNCNMQGFTLGKKLYGLYVPIGITLTNNSTGKTRAFSGSQFVNVDMQAFSESVQNICLSELKAGYEKVWAGEIDTEVNKIVEKNADKIASYAAQFGLEEPMKEVIMAWYNKNGLKFSKESFKLLTYPSKLVVAHCPVNLYIYDANGNVAGSIEDDEVTLQGDGMALWTEGDDKYAQLFYDDYTIKYQSTDTGTMDLEIHEMSNGVDDIRVCSYSDIPLSKGLDYTGSLPNDIFVPDKTFNLTANNDTVIDNPKTDYPTLPELHTHTYKTQTTESTCISEGKIVYTCDCGASYTKILPKADHKWDDGTITKEATCTEAGVKTYTCTICKTTKDEEIEAKGHSFTNYIYNNDAQVGKDGTETATCDNGCGTTDTRTKSGSALPKPTTPVTEIFSDIYPSAWYIDYVQFVYDNGLMTGTSKTTFEPETTLSRAMVAQVLYNYDKRVDSPYRATNGKTFKDVSKNDWFYEAIQWASANGIASGVGNGCFEPNSPVTREQVAQFLYNYNGRPSVSGNLPFSDADKVSGWAKNAMLWAYQNKIINGTTSSDGGLLLDPQGGATRAQAAAILTNYMRNMM